MIQRIAILTILLGLLGCNAAQAKASKEPAAYLFSYFLDNGQDGLHLAYSEDGLTWTALKQGQSFLTPKVGGKLMRDPCICTGPDNEFHMVWTSSWQDRGIGVAHSKDLVNWSDQAFVPVMGHEPMAHNCWAPEIYYDQQEKEYIIYWSTTIPGRFPATEVAQGDRAGKISLNHRIYCTTTKDFKIYTKTRLFYNDNFNVIDATIARDNNQYLLFVKDETKSPKAQKNIRLAIGKKAQGPYGSASAPITPKGLWVEGPTVLKIDDTWHLYYDAYTKHHYAGLKSTDLKTWEEITDQLHFPKGTRHGTAFEVPASVLENLRSGVSGDTHALEQVGPIAKASKWTLVWQDDFVSDQLDNANWTRCTRGNPDWKNTMSDDPRLLKIKDGVLQLRGIVNDTQDKDPAPYLTAGLSSKGKFAFQYGKVQIRARVKSAQGAWPALWMLGAEKGWPANGEIDLMEHLNFDDIIYQTVHSEYTIKIDKTNTPKKGGTAKITRDGWNTYGCEWETDKIVFTVNDKPTHTYPRVQALGDKQWPFDQPFYFILSMQIGGNWVNGPGPTNPAHYPAHMEIDWVRVYSQKKPPR